MINQVDTSCNIIATSTFTPNNITTTDNLVWALADKMSEDMRFTASHVGVAERYTIVEDLPDYLSGKIKRRLIADTSILGANALKKCIETENIDPSNICLLICITNTSNRHFPCFGYEVLNKLAPLLSPEINVINMQDQGCSVLLKAIEIAQQYIAVNPLRQVAIVAAECHSGLIEPLFSKKYYSLHEANELMHQHPEENEIVKSMKMIEAFLFGDGAVAFILGKNEARTELGLIKHLTDVDKKDTEILHMDEGGILKPKYAGFPKYIMSPEVPARGAYYSARSVNSLLHTSNALFTDINQADLYLIHTGSKKILDGVCQTLHIEPNSEKISRSYDILNRFGNLSSASVGFMIDKNIHQHAHGNGLIVSFGVGFSCSTGFINFK